MVAQSYFTGRLHVVIPKPVNFIIKKKKSFTLIILVIIKKSINLVLLYICPIFSADLWLALAFGNLSLVQPVRKVDL